MIFDMKRPSLLVPDVGAFQLYRDAPPIRFVVQLWWQSMIDRPIKAVSAFGHLTGMLHAQEEWNAGISLKSLLFAFAAPKEASKRGTRKS